MSDSPTGWTNFGGQSRKWHFVAEDGRSLCGNWLLWKGHELAQGNEDSPDNCAGCQRRLKKRGEPR